MTQPHLFDQVADELAKTFSVDRHAITPDVTLEQLGLDSLALLELTVRFEDQTGIELPDTGEAGLGTTTPLSAICAALQSVLPPGQAGAPLFPGESP
ncbi:acyl carrier protein [Streptomyces sp. SCA3-4]|uniref:acyl carrier protein n=1 Tax=Streptomyces sichuanensis TaxID=2871810 RepID=UPI001CE33666|nr:acyl carrier protein [Streptomyces sichuanensis]MCA6091908.1 acyl carrier protein [Streptomyces sichuanensis]